MMYAKREKRMQPVATAGLILGLLTLNPIHAGAADRFGLSQAELNTLLNDSQGSKFEVYLDKNELEVVGMVPKVCLQNAQASYGAQDGKHMVTLDFPNCRDGHTHTGNAADENDRVPLSSAQIRGLPITLDPKVSGKVYLSRSFEGDPRSRRRPDAEVLQDSDGKDLEFTSKADLAKSEEDKLVKAQEEQGARERAELIKARELEKQKTIDTLAGLCSRKDYAGLGEQIRRLSDVLGDVADQLLAKIDNGMKNELLKVFKNAKGEGAVDKMRDAYQALQAMADDKGWDSDEMDKIAKSYIAARVALVQQSVDSVDSKKAASEASSQVKDLIADLKDMDMFKKNKSQIAFLYSGIATNVGNAVGLDESVRYYEQAEKFSDSAGVSQIEGTLRDAFKKDAEDILQKWKECVDKNKLNPSKCDKIAAKYKGRLKNALAHAKAAGKGDDDDSVDEATALKTEMITSFGIEGPSMKVQGFGDLSMNPMAAGALEQYKKQAVQQGMQEQQMKLMTQMGMVNPAMMLNSPLGGGLAGGFNGGLAGGMLR
jgi:hypothetical protein